MRPLSIRAARATDIPAIAALYNAGIRERTATFETRERTVVEIEPWLDERLSLLERLLGPAADAEAESGP